MRKILALILLTMLCASSVYAVSDNPTTIAVNSSSQATGVVNVNYEDQSNFGKIGAWGNTSTGNPGYLVLKGCDANNRCYPYYIWVASDGKVYLASYITISAYSSFPSGNWNRSNMAVGTVIGSQ